MTESIKADPALLAAKSNFVSKSAFAGAKNPLKIDPTLVAKSTFVSKSAMANFKNSAMVGDTNSAMLGAAKLATSGDTATKSGMLAAKTTSTRLGAADTKSRMSTRSTGDAPSTDSLDMPTQYRAPNLIVEDNELAASLAGATIAGVPKSVYKNPNPKSVERKPFFNRFRGNTGGPPNLLNQATLMALHAEENKKKRQRKIVIGIVIAVVVTVVVLIVVITASVVATKSPKKSDSIANVASSSSTTG